MNEINEIRMVSNLVLIGPYPLAERTASGLTLLPEKRRTVMTGMVLDAGPGIYDKKGKLIPVTVQPGDSVVFSTTDCVTADVQGETLMIVKFPEILAKLANVTNQGN
jgi:chaperonin GroES